MKTWVLVLLGSVCGVAQSSRFDVGAIGGVPVSETLHTYEYFGRSGGFHQSTSATRRYVVGGTVGARLNDRLSLSLGVLYRRFGYDYDVWGPYPVPLSFTHFRGNGTSWEVPLMMRVDLIRRRRFTSYVAVGATYRRLAGLREIQTQYDNFFLTNPKVVGTSQTDQPGTLLARDAVAPTGAAGLEFRKRRVTLGPEIRYTRWLTDTLGGFGDPIRWNPRRVDILLRIGFRMAN